MHALSERALCLASDMLKVTSTNYPSDQVAKRSVDRTDREDRRPNRGQVVGRNHCTPAGPYGRS
eukprot:8444983-Alexandrium_andersonii.AAC.1